MSLALHSPTLDRFLARLRPSPAHNALLVAVPSLASLLLLYTDYHAWLSFGTGGTPPTLSGYAKSTWLRVRRALHFPDADGRRDLRDAEAILPEAWQKEERHGMDLQGWLRKKNTLSERKGPRPQMVGRPLPQRQKPQPLDESLTKRLFGIIPALHAAHPDVLTLDLSITEGQSSDALFANSRSMPPEAELVKKELAHVHPADNSLHVLLCPKDATRVVAKGWGERFCMSWVPSGWELEVVERIVKAAVSFGTGRDILE
ncbi:hypothetical protein JCM10207_008246 [Rhodosporidiobolus poonsookiae]